MCFADKPVSLFHTFEGSRLRPRGSDVACFVASSVAACSHWRGEGLQQIRQPLKHKRVPAAFWTFLQRDKVATRRRLAIQIGHPCPKSAFLVNPYESVRLYPPLTNPPQQRGRV